MTALDTNRAHYGTDHDLSQDISHLSLQRNTFSTCNLVEFCNAFQFVFRVKGQVEGRYLVEYMYDILPRSLILSMRDDTTQNLSCQY